MITQELIDYVKTQLSAGISREQITSDLLGQGGWTVEQINEAFQASQQSVPVHMPQEETSFEMTQAPKSIKYFEWLMYASFVASAAIWIFQFGSAGFSSAMITAIAMPFIGILIKFVCVYRVVYHRAEWARIVLVVLLALNAFSIFGFFFYAFTNPLFLIIALPLILEIAAIYYVFTSPSSVWLALHTSSSTVGVSTANNLKWTKVIPRINKRLMIISLILFLVVDLFILIIEPELFPFWAAMAVVMVIFVGFYRYENNTLKERFANSNSRLDSSFIALTTIRNVVFVLNFIPFIQLLGGAVLIFGGVPYLIVYYFMIRARNKSVVTV
jgi:hypothetical protein